MQRLLGDAGVIACFDLWSYAAQARPSGELDGLTAEDIADEVDYKGGARELVDAMLSVGLLEGSEGSYRIHNWDKHNPYAASYSTRSATARKAVHTKHVKNRAYHKRTEFCDDKCLIKDEKRPESPTSGGGGSSTESCEEHTQRNESYTDVNAASTPSPYPYPSPNPDPSPNTDRATNTDAYEPYTLSKQEQAPSIDDAGASPHIGPEGPRCTELVLRPTEVAKTPQEPMRSEIDQVIAAWGERYPRRKSKAGSKAAKKLRAMIRERLEGGCEISSIIKAIEGIGLDDWEGRKRHMALKYVVKSDEAIDRFCSFVDNPPRPKMSKSDAEYFAAMEVDFANPFGPPQTDYGPPVDGYQSGKTVSG